MNTNKRIAIISASVAAGVLGAFLIARQGACSPGAEEAPDAAVAEPEAEPRANAGALAYVWAARLTAVAGADTPTALATLAAYDAEVDDATKDEIASFAGPSLGAAMTLTRLANLRHANGDFEGAVELYDRAAARADQPAPRTWLAFRRALAAHGLDRNSGTLHADAALVADLETIETAMPRDDFSDQLAYHIAVAGVVAGEPDVARLTKVADRAAADESTDPEVRGTAISLAAYALAREGKIDDAARRIDALERLDQRHGTHFAEAGLGARALVEARTAGRSTP
jgi:tetratricopeptide (TPR) repeat protein